jgi:hypothetical protein
VKIAIVVPEYPPFTIGGGSSPTMFDLTPHSLRLAILAAGGTDSVPNLLPTWITVLEQTVNVWDIAVAR